MYALVSKTGKKGEEKLRHKSIIYMGQDLMRKKSIDPDHKHEGMQPHVHHGYEHNEDDPPRGATRLTAEEDIMKMRVERLWLERYNDFNK